VTEEQRRKEFVKAAHDVMKVWPGYAAHKFPEPTNRTDQCLQCDLRFRQEMLTLAWQDSRAGRATDADFMHYLVSWRTEWLYASELFYTGKPNEKDALDTRKKQAIIASRSKCKFKSQGERK
jgi:hypothetical protein